MYCSHYGFSEKPFEVTPDPKLLYLSPVHREVISTLLYGIQERRGFIVVLGEAGTGKTTVLRSIIEQLQEDLNVASIVSPDVTFNEFLHMLLMELGLAKENEKLENVVAVQRLNDFAINQLSKSSNVVIMVDEAQNMNRRCLENLRILSNLETSKTKLIQIILSGQPELEDKLKRHDLRQLTQRINLRRQLVPLNEQETYACIQHRLDVAHYEGSALFSDDAQRLIWEYSGGIPRMINTVCDNALLTGYALKRSQIDESIVQEVIGDLTGSLFIEGAAKSKKISSSAIADKKSGKINNLSRLLMALLSIACLILVAGIGMVTWQYHNTEKSPTTSQDQIQTKDDASIIVKKGESLSSIIIQRFGKYDEVIEQDLLRANPSIKNPERLSAGQIIILPDLTTATEN
jgi:general secretion pathway protein A